MKLEYRLDWHPVKTWYARYASGELRVADIAKELHVGSDTVRAWFRRHGLSTTVHARYRVTMTKDQLRAMHKRYLGGEKIITLADEVPTSTQNMLILFKKAGLPTFRMGTNPNSRRDRVTMKPRENAPRFTGDNTRVGDWAPKTEAHDCITVDGECLLCHRKRA